MKESTALVCCSAINLSLGLLFVFYVTPGSGAVILAVNGVVFYAAGRILKALGK